MWDKSVVPLANSTEEGGQDDELKELQKNRMQKHVTVTVAQDEEMSPQHGLHSCSNFH